MASDNKKVVRRIKASADDTSAKPRVARNSTASEVREGKKPATTSTKTVEKSSKPSTKAKRTDNKSAKRTKKPFILFRPFIALGRYIRDSWRELRKVEWPSRHATWKMTLAVIVFCVIIGVLVLVLDWASQWLIQEVIL